MAGRMPAWCNTCQKRAADGSRCQVLTDATHTERLGYCFAWSEDPSWLQKVEQAVAEYSLRLARLIVAA